MGCKIFFLDAFGTFGLLIPGLRRRLLLELERDFFLTFPWSLICSNLLSTHCQVGLKDLIRFSVVTESCSRRQLSSGQIRNVFCRIYPFLSRSQFCSYRSPNSMVRLHQYLLTCTVLSVLGWKPKAKVHFLQLLCKGDSWLRLTMCSKCITFLCLKR